MENAGVEGVRHLQWQHRKMDGRKYGRKHVGLAGSDRAKLIVESIRRMTPNKLQENFLLDFSGT